MTNEQAEELMDTIVGAADKIADAITAPVAPGTDASGGTVTCLTEAVMGVSAALNRIADAIDGLSGSISEGLRDQYVRTPKDLQ
jgi:hypothetical protein